MSKQVLIVDDDRPLARALTRAIEAEGYEAAVVHDGEAALVSLQKQTPGMVLLDLLLPKRDGRAVLAWLRAREETRELPVVVMSGVFRSRSHGADLQEEGAQAFLDKPFRRSDLRGSLRRYLGRPVKKEEKREGAAPVYLAEQPVAAALWEHMSKGLTGALEFRHGKRVKILRLEEGRPIWIRSNMARECLGQRLATDGRVSQQAVDESLRRMKSHSRRQGEILVEMGELSAGDLADELQRQSEEKLLQLFTWTEGEMVKRERVDGLAQGSELVDWTPRRTVLAGVEFMSSSRAERQLSRYREREVSRAEIRLEPDEAELPVVARLLGALEQPTSLRHLALDHASALYGLTVVGALHLEAKDDGATTVGLDEIEGRLESSRQQNYFEILGVPRDATTPVIRKAFLDLAKRFHPDRMSGESAYTSQVAAELFARMSEAHDTLSDKEQRKVYVEALKARTEGKEGSASASIVAAEMQFQRGEVLLKQRDYAGALERFRSALDLNNQEGEFHAYYAWTHALAHPGDPESQKLSVDHFQQAAKLAPKSANVYYLFGMYRKACEDTAGAERMFRKVVEIRPDHLEASRELRLTALRREKERSEGGIFGFKKKK